MVVGGRELWWGCGCHDGDGHDRLVISLNCDGAAAQGRASTPAGREWWALGRPKGSEVQRTTHPKSILRVYLSITCIPRNAKNSILVFDTAIGFELTQVRLWGDRRDRPDIVLWGSLVGQEAWNRWPALAGSINPE